MRNSSGGVGETRLFLDGRLVVAGSRRVRAVIREKAVSWEDELVVDAGDIEGVDEISGDE